MSGSLLPEIRRRIFGDGADDSNHNNQHESNRGVNSSSSSSATSGGVGSGGRSDAASSVIQSQIAPLPKKYVHQRYNMPYRVKDDPHVSLSRRSNVGSSLDGSGGGAKSYGSIQSFSRSSSKLKPNYNLLVVEMNERVEKVRSAVSLMDDNQQHRLLLGVTAMPRDRIHGKDGKKGSKKKVSNKGGAGSNGASGRDSSNSRNSRRDSDTVAAAAAGEEQMIDPQLASICVSILRGLESTFASSEVYPQLVQSVSQFIFSPQLRPSALLKQHQLKHSKEGKKNRKKSVSSTSSTESSSNNMSGVEFHNQHESVMTWMEVCDHLMTERELLLARTQQLQQQAELDHHEINSMRETVQDLNITVKHERGLGHQRKELQGAHARHIKSLQDRLELANNRLYEANESARQQSSRIAMLESQLQSLTDKKSEADSRVSALANTDETQQRVHLLANQLQLMHDRTRKLESQLASQATVMEAQTSTLRKKCQLLNEREQERDHARNEVKRVTKYYEGKIRPLTPRMEWQAMYEDFKDVDVVATLLYNANQASLQREQRKESLYDMAVVKHEEEMAARAFLPTGARGNGSRPHSQSSQRSDASGVSRRAGGARSIASTSRPTSRQQHRSSSQYGSIGGYGGSGSGGGNDSRSMIGSDGRSVGDRSSVNGDVNVDNNNDNRSVTEGSSHDITDVTHLLNLEEDQFDPDDNNITSSEQLVLLLKALRAKDDELSRLMHEMTIMMSVHQTSQLEVAQLRTQLQLYQNTLVIDGVSPTLSTSAVTAASAVPTTMVSRMGSAGAGLVNSASATASGGGDLAASAASSGTTSGGDDVVVDGAAHDHATSAAVEALRLLQQQQQQQQQLQVEAQQLALQQQHRRTQEGAARMVEATTSNAFTVHQFSSRDSHNNFFQGLGVTNDVPKYLRISSKVRNRRMTKKEAEQVLKSIWAAKMKWDTSGVTPQLEMHLCDFLYFYLKKKHGVQSVMVEWGYNLIAALQRYDYDADCRLFYKVLTGQLSEETYYDQRIMMQKLEQLFIKTDLTVNGPVANRKKKLDTSDVATTTAASAGDTTNSAGLGAMSPPTSDGGSNSSGIAKPVHHGGHHNASDGSSAAPTAISPWMTSASQLVGMYSNSHFLPFPVVEQMLRAFFPAKSAVDLQLILTALLDIALYPDEIGTAYTPPACFYRGKSPITSKGSKWSSRHGSDDSVNSTAAASSSIADSTTPFIFPRTMPSDSDTAAAVSDPSSNSSSHPSSPSSRVGSASRSGRNKTGGGGGNIKRAQALSSTEHAIDVSVTFPGRVSARTLPREHHKFLVIRQADLFRETRKGDVCEAMELMLSQHLNEIESMLMEMMESAADLPTLGGDGGSSNIATSSSSLIPSSAAGSKKSSASPHGGSGSGTSGGSGGYGAGSGNHDKSGKSGGSGGVSQTQVLLYDIHKLWMRIDVHANAQSVSQGIATALAVHTDEIPYYSYVNYVSFLTVMFQSGLVKGAKNYDIRALRLEWIDATWRATSTTSYVKTADWDHAQCVVLARHAEYKSRYSMNLSEACKQLRSQRTQETRKKTYSSAAKSASSRVSSAASAKLFVCCECGEKRRQASSASSSPSFTSSSSSSSSSSSLPTARETKSPSPLTLEEDEHTL